MNSFLKKLFLLTYFSISLCYSQDVKNKFDIKKDSLLNSDIQLLIEYEMVSGDNMIPLIETDCIDYETKYLFWIVENNCFSQKYSDCTFNERIKLKDCRRLMEVYNNLDVIKESEVLPVTMENGDYIEFVHEDDWYYNVYTKDDHFFKSIGKPTWEMKYSSDKKENVNYEKNHKSKIKLLVDLRKDILE